ncbi:MAG TPA: amino acid permease [Coriobacteriia bacterium]|nr:amino acid permease [Coriobacteriia bacterium]
MSEQSVPAKKKVFGLASMILFSVSAILVGDTIASSAAMGVQGLTFWIVLGVLFFIPYGFVTAELGAAWPDDGGIYVWVREAFGPMWGTVTAWLYWVNVALWAPSVFVLFLYSASAAFGLTLPLWGEALVVITLIWLMVIIGVLPMRYSKWVPNVSAGVKLIVFVILGLAGVAAALNAGELANSFALSEWVPVFSFDSLTYLPIVIYSFMGFELMSSVGDSIRNPRRDVPKMIFGAGAAILFVYMFATFGILAVIPAESIVIETGIVDALRPAFESVLGAAAGPVFTIVALGVLFTFIGNMVTWSIGANKAIAATGMDKTAPGVFAHKHPKNDTPDYAFYLMGVIATVLTIVTYTLFGDNEGIFWAIFSLSSVVFLLPYLLMFPALVVLRRKFPDQNRPFVVPGGNGGAWLWAVLCELGILFTLALFFLAPPEGTPLGAFYAITIGGTVISVAVGFWLHSHAGKTRAVNAAA